MFWENLRESVLCPNFYNSELWYKTTRVGDICILDICILDIRKKMRMWSSMTELLKQITLNTNTNQITKTFGNNYRSNLCTQWVNNEWEFFEGLWFLRTNSKIFQTIIEKWQKGSISNRGYRRSWWRHKGGCSWWIERKQLHTPKNCFLLERKRQKLCFIPEESAFFSIST